MSFDFFARLQTHEGAAYLCDRLFETHLDSTLLKLLFGIGTQIVLERGEHFFPHFHNDDPRFFGGEVVVIAGEKVVEEIRERACGFNSRWPGAYNHKVERAIFNQSRVAVGRFKSFQYSVAELDRIRESVE